MPGEALGVRDHDTIRDLSKDVTKCMDFGEALPPRAGV